MAEKIIKKCLIFALIVVMVSYQGNVGVVLASAVIHEKITDLNVPDEVNLTKSNEKIVGDSKDIALKDGKEAGEKLLQIDSDKQYIEAVSEVLHTYYGQKEITSQLDRFTNQVKPCAEEVLSDYREAHDERMEADSLSYNPERVILRFRNNISDSSIKKAMEVISDGGELISEEEVDSDWPAYKKDRIMKTKASAKKSKVAVVDLSLAQSTDKAIEAYKELDGVCSAERDEIMEVASADQTVADSVISNDTRVADQWSLIQTNTAGAWGLLNQYKYHTHPVWVAVIDTGVDMNHEDLQGQLLKDRSVDITKPGYPLLTNVSPQYTSEHGTHVAGIVAAKAKNSIGVAGVAGITDSNEKIMNCKIMAIKATQLPRNFYTSDVINSIFYATNKGAEVINLSLGGPSFQSAYKAAIDYAYEKGVTVVAAAGNDGRNMSFYPADYDHVISVISTDINRNRSFFSNYGGKDISAPGGNILSTVPGNAYKYDHGTSMAAPFVAGVVALMKEADYSLRPDDLERIIKDTAYDIGIPGYDPETAYGVVDPYHAVRRALSLYK